MEILGNEEGKKWQGKAKAKLNDRISAEQVWPLLQDFCSFHKWLPTIDTCHQVKGGLKGQQQPPAATTGLVRYCASSTNTPQVSLDDECAETSAVQVKWCHERLIAIDPKEHCMSYEVLENNMGLKSYVATIKVMGDKVCEMEWSYLADPVEGLTCHDLSDYLSFALKAMAERMEKALITPPQSSP